MRLVALVAATVAGALRPPVIHEPFTVLACPMHPTTTVALEGCAEHALLASDRMIDGQAKKIFALLQGTAARTAFVGGERAWLAYRKSSCDAESSKYAGGSLQPVEFAQCEVARDKVHLAELSRMARALAAH